MPSPERKSYTCPVLGSTHQRYLLSRVHRIDELVGDAIGALEPKEDDRLYRPVNPDATPAQQKILTDYLGQIRFALRRFMAAQRIEETATPVSGLWSLRTALVFAQTAAVEMRPSYMRGYGKLDADAAAACERLVGELTALLKRVMDFLDKGAGGDLAARLARLDATADTASLRELERIISAHGIVELRAPLEDLVERAATPRYEIAVFGKVNVGKSSLLNWWLDRPVLPTGVTPVTAVPTRIVHGATARAQVQLASATPVTATLEQIAAYVTEAGNPGNTKHVLAVTIEVPSLRLAEGIRLVDTPGLSSLAAAGALQTVEYLPRCDLAIQMIEAGAPLGREDLNLARAVLDSGSELLVALSKADRLGPAELVEARAYVERQFDAALGLRCPVDPVSTIADRAILAREWFDRQLAPRVADHRARAATQLQRKTAVLRENVSAALEARLRSAANRDAPRAAVPAAAIDDLSSRPRLALESARTDLRLLISKVRDAESWVMDGAAVALVDCWTRSASGPDARAQRLEQALARRAADLGDLVADILGRCRAELEKLLAQARSASATGPELPQSRGRPIFDAAGLAALMLSERPAWAPAIRRLLLALARNRLNAAVQRALAERLRTYSEALRRWSTAYLEELSRSVEELLALEEARARLGSTESLTPEAAEAVRRDLTLLATPAQRD